MNRLLTIGAIVVVTVLSASVAARAADEIKGRYRIYLMSGRSVAGDVTQLENGAYEVKNKYGMIITIRKNQVKAIVPLEEDRLEQRRTPSPGERKDIDSLLRRSISDEEIEELLAGIEAEVDESVVGISHDDLMVELPLNQEDVDEMVRQAGGKDKAKVLIRPHFVMVYTGTSESAQALGSRLEVIWKWNAKFLSMLNVPAKRPEYKMEVYYFGTHKEFIDYSLNQGTQLPSGVLGYYTSEVNRSHFFDLWTWAQFEGIRRELENKNTSPARRRHLRNYINRWVESNNLEVIQHETGHHLHFNTGVFTQRGPEGGLAPTWLVEGATMMFEVPPSTTGRGGASLGDRNDSRLHEFRQHFPRRMEPGELKQFIIDNSVWMNGQYDYPRGWAVVYYLWMEHREGLGEYVRKIHEREELGEDYTRTAREEDFESCFGRLDDDWIEKFYTFIDGLQVRRSRLPPEL